MFYTSRRRHAVSLRDWSSDVCSSDLRDVHVAGRRPDVRTGERREILSRFRQRVIGRSWARLRLGVRRYARCRLRRRKHRSEEHTSELQSRRDLVCRLLLEKKKKKKKK